MITKCKAILKSLLTKARKKLGGFKKRLLMRRRFLLEAYYGAQSPRNGRLRKLLFFAAAQFLCLLGLYDESPAWHRDYLKWTSRPAETAPESALRKTKSYTQFAKQMLACDVISFDVFDTLVLRPFDRPSSVFFLLGQKHKCPGFQKYRVQAEKDARRAAFEKMGTYEVTLEDIYKRLRRYVLLDTEKAMALEIEIEIGLAFANPYMKNVFAQAKNLGKRLIAISDMYLPRDAILRILEKCGYSGLEDVFVSCELGENKRDGLLFDFVRASMGINLKYLHIGDNYTSDFLSPRDRDWDAEYYKNVNHAGNVYRAHDLTELVGSAYRGIVNAHLQSGADTFSQYYEYGYAYAGFFALGYCGFIHDHVKNTGVDKVLFLSRDGYLLGRVYDLLYPDENTEYVYWSRTAGIQLALGRYSNEFFLRYLKYKIPQALPLSALFKAMELPHFCDQLPAPLSSDTILTKENYEDVVAFFRANWADVLAAYRDKHAAAKTYYAEVTRNCRHVCAVDIGWAASGYNSLRYLIEDEWGLGVKVTGLVAGSKNINDKDVIEAQLLDGSIEAYMFSQRTNPQYFRAHQVKKLYSVFCEIMLSAPFPSFKGFLPDGNGGYRLSFDLPEAEGYGMMREIEQGAMDFVRDYTSAFMDYPCMMNIPGSDVYAACLHVISRPDTFRNLFGEYPVQRAVGHASPEMMTLTQLMDREFVGKEGARVK